MNTEVVYHTTKPGREATIPGISGMMVNGGNGLFINGSASWENSVSKRMCVRQGGFLPYTAGLFTVTNDGGGTFGNASGSVGKGGINWTDSAPADGEDATLQTKQFVTTALNKPYLAWCEVQLSKADDMGLSFGFVTSTAVDPITTAPADAVYFVKAKNAATIVGRVIQNSATAADSGTLATLADSTWYRFGVQFQFGNGSPTDYTTAANASGSFCNFIVGTLNATTGDWSYTITGATATQLAQLILIYNTTPAVFAGHIGTLANGTTSRTMYIAGLDFEVHA